jgi:4'-phosphopantetheinyl transferase
MQGPAADVVSLIWLDLDGTPDAGRLRGLLDPDERARADRLPAGRSRDRFIVGRGLLRRALGGLLGIDPAVVRLAPGPHGKPALAGSPNDVRFNVSHSRHRGVIAIARGREVGVDLEAARGIDVPLLARRVLSPNELAALLALPPAERPPALFRCFARKESFVKALGAGLSLSLRALDVGLGPCSASLRWRSRGPTWTTVSLDAGAGYAAALTAAGDGWTVQAHDTASLFE